MKVNPEVVYIIDWQEGIWRSDERLHNLLRSVGMEMEWSNDGLHPWSMDWDDDEESAGFKLNTELQAQGYTNEDKILIHYRW
jgi:hypothetical protein